MCVKVDSVMTSCLEVGCGPFLVLFLEVALDPGDGDGGPDTCPEEGKDPADLVMLAQRE